VQIVNADFSGMQQVTRRVQRINPAVAGAYRFQFPPVRNLTNAENEMVRHVTETTPFSFLPVAHPETSRITLLLRSESIDQSGSRATNFGVYNVFGFETGEEVASNFPNHALYLRGNLRLYSPVHIIGGPTYIENRGNASSGAAIYLSGAGGQLSTFEGDFKLIQGPNAPESNLYNVTFLQSAYFEGGRVQFQGIGATPAINFQGSMGGNAGFNFHTVPANISPNRSAVFSEGATFTGYSSTYNFKFGTGGTLRYDPQVTITTDLTNLSTVPPSQTTTNANVLTALGLSPTPPPPIITLPQEILNKRLRIHGGASSITGTMLNTLFNDPANAAHIHICQRDNTRRWLVLEVVGPAHQHGTSDAPLASGGTAFTGRAIIINRSGGGWGLPEVQTTGASRGNVLFYVPPDFGDAPRTTNDIRFSQIGGNFRGFFFNASPSTQIQFSVNTPWQMRGSYYNRGRDDGLPTAALLFQGAGAQLATIRFDQEVIDELGDLGIFTAADGNDGTGGVNAFLPIPRILFPIRTSMQNRSF
jgi:hypothetical protein